MVVGRIIERSVKSIELDTSAVDAVGLLTEENAQATTSAQRKLAIGNGIQLVVDGGAKVSISTGDDASSVQIV